MIRRRSSAAPSVLTTILLSAVAIAPPPPPATAAPSLTNGRLWDRAHRLSSRERANLEKQLAAASRRLGSPIFLLVADKLGPEGAPALAERAFAEHGLGADPRSNPVLLVISERERAAAIATGKGSAGIVPEMDARRIVTQLVSRLGHGGLVQSLSPAIDAIVESAQATAARRRPMSPEEDLQVPDAYRPGGTTASDDKGQPERKGEGKAPAASADPADAPDEGVTAGTDDGAKPVEKPPRRSRVPIAAGVAGLIILALAIRRRRNLTAARKERPTHDHDRPPGPRRW